MRPQHAWPNHVFDKLIHGHLLWYFLTKTNLYFSCSLWDRSFTGGAHPTADAIKTTEKGEVQVRVAFFFPLTENYSLGYTAGIHSSGLASLLNFQKICEPHNIRLVG